MEDAKKAGDNAAVKLAENVIMDANKIKKDIYVDDGMTGGSPEDVKRMKGVKKPDGRFDGSISQILGEIGYNIKSRVWR